MGSSPSSDPPTVLFAAHGTELSGGGVQALVEFVLLMADSGRYVPEVAVSAPGPLEHELHRHSIKTHIVPTKSWAPTVLPKTCTDKLGPTFGSVAWRTATLLAVGYSTARWVRLLREVSPIAVVPSSVGLAPVAFAGRLERTPVLWWIQEALTRDHGLEFFCGDTVARRAMALTSDAFVFNSLATQSHFSPTLTKLPHGVSYCAIPRRATMRPERDLDRPVLRMLLIGRITEKKGATLAVDSLVEFDRAGGAGHLRIVGTGDASYVRSLQQRADDLSDRSTLELKGFSTEPAAEIGWADVLLMTSEWEAFGRVTAEALVHGCPVIGTAAGGTVELIDDGTTGLLVDRSAPSIVAALRWADKNRSALAEMGRRGAEANAIRFTPELQLESFSDILESAIASSPSIEPARAA